MVGPQSFDISQSWMILSLRNCPKFHFYLPFSLLITYICYSQFITFMLFHFYLACGVLINQPWFVGFFHLVLAIV
jgi:hypothetical protein